jgi:L-ascorbate metabolism protein UlaG (beta-lactamase superfamily)
MAPARVEGNELVLDTALGPLRVVPGYHATTRIQAGSLTFWLDPWSKAPLAGAPPADVILVTDIHPDHLDLAAIDQIRKPETLFVAPPDAVSGLAPNTVAHPLRNGETAQIGGVTVEAVAMYNLTRGPEPGKLFHDKGRGNGYKLTYGGRTVYFAGDTECTDEMRALRGIDLAFLPMNLPYTMPVDEAAACVDAFGPTVVVPYHYAGSDLAAFQAAIKNPAVQVAKVEYYSGGLPW